MQKEELMMKILTASPEVLSKVAWVLQNEGAGLARTEPSDRRLLTLTAAADALGCSRQTIWRMVKDGRLPAIELRAGRHRVPSAALTSLLKGGAA